LPEQLSVLRAGVLPSEASAGIDSARLIFARDFDAMEEGAQSRHDIEHSAYFLFDAVYALELCSRTLDRLWWASGAHPLFEGSSIPQKFRDLHAMSQHGGADC